MGALVVADVLDSGICQSVPNMLVIGVENQVQGKRSMPAMPGMWQQRNNLASDISSMSVVSLVQRNLAISHGSFAAAMKYMLNGGTRDNQQGL